MGNTVFIAERINIGAGKRRRENPSTFMLCTRLVRLVRLAERLAIRLATRFIDRYMRNLLKLFEFYTDF